MKDNLPASVTAMLPAHARKTETLETIRRLYACQPPPAEILVHLADTQLDLIAAVRSFFPEVHLLLSTENLGPGGARNRMIKAASHEIVASFDDDSYPIESDFFAQLLQRFEELTEASILALSIDEPNLPAADKAGPREVAGFVGCGCAYRRSHFLEDDGYVPIPIAYSMEEADLALRYAERNRAVYFVPTPRIYHNTVLQHHAEPRVAASQVANTALFVYLRYPLSRWPLGCAQVANKWLDTVKRKRWRGALLALPVFFSQLSKYRSYRKTVQPDVLDRQRKLSVSVSN